MSHRRFVIGIVASLALVAACKGKNAASGSTGSGSAGASGSPGSSGSADTPPPPDPLAGPVVITHNVPEFSGTYDRAFAQLQNDATVVELVRGCPAMKCDVGLEIEQIVKVCPNAFIATVKLPKQEVGKYHLDLTLAGPASNVATVTIEGVAVEFLHIANEGVDGTLSEENTDTAAHGTFKAEVCPLT